MHLYVLQIASLNYQPTDIDMISIDLMELILRTVNVAAVDSNHLKSDCIEG